MLVDGESKTPAFGTEFVLLQTRLISSFGITESTTPSLSSKLHAYVILLAGVVAVLMAHGGRAGLVLGGVLAMGICALSLRWPEIGLLSTFPLLYAMDPTPVGIGGKEGLFAALIAATFVGSVIKERLRFLQLLRGPFGIFASVVTLFILVNLWVSSQYGVAFQDWLRGLIPFLFIAYQIPVFLLVRGNPSLRVTLFVSVGVAAAFFSAHVMQVFLMEKLWEPKWYLFQDATWVPITEEMASERNYEGTMRFSRRVTMVLQQSTDALLPLSAVWGITGYVFLSQKLWRAGALGCASIGTIAMIMTYTRSMLLTTAMASLGIGALAWWKNNLARFLIALLVLVTVAFSTIKEFHLEPIYLNRLFQLTSFVNLSFLVQPASLVNEPSPMDDNILTRMEEYQVAWKMFVESPMLGKGLGIKHHMKFADGHGHVLEQDVGYIHNWVLYMLMVGGIVGTALYTWLIIGPGVLVMRKSSLSDELRSLLVMTLVALTIYALWFAVFRLLSFNLLLAVAWGIALAQRNTDSDIHTR